MKESTWLQQTTQACIRLVESLTGFLLHERHGAPGSYICCEIDFRRCFRWACSGGWCCRASCCWSRCCSCCWRSRWVILNKYRWWRLQLSKWCWCFKHRLSTAHQWAVSIAIKWAMSMLSQSPNHLCDFSTRRHSSKSDGDFEVSWDESPHLLLCHAVLQKTSYSSRSHSTQFSPQFYPASLPIFAEGGTPGKPVRAPASNLFTDGMGFDM